MLNFKVLLSSLLPGSMLTAWVDVGQMHVVAQVVCAVLISFGIFIAILHATGRGVEHEDASPDHKSRFAKQRVARRY